MTTQQIRGNLQIMDGTLSGAVVVEQAGGTPSVNNADKIIFSGATVTDLGNGDALVTISGGTNGITEAQADARYLKLDASNDPITGTLNVNIGASQVDPSVDILATNFAGLNIYQITNGNPVSISSPALSIARTQQAPDTTVFNQPAIQVTDIPGTGPITGDFISYERSSITVFNVTASGHAYDNGELLITEAPVDGNSYARKDGDWVTVSGGAGSTLVVEQYGGSPSVSDVDKIVFSGATVTDLGSGDALVTIEATRHNGWILVSDTWTRTGSYTFTVGGDVTATYRKGTKVRYKDGGTYEYGTVISSSYSSPNTTITLATTSDYAMAAATITDTYISYIENPEGFPTSFNFTPSWNNVTVGNATQVAKYSIQRGFLSGFVTFKWAASPTSSFSGSISLNPPVAFDATLLAYCTLGEAGLVDWTNALYMGECINGGSVIEVRCINAASTYAVWQAVNATAPFTWAGSDLLTMQFSYFI